MSVVTIMNNQLAEVQSERSQNKDKGYRGRIRIGQFVICLAWP